MIRLKEKLSNKKLIALILVGFLTAGLSFFLFAQTFTKALTATTQIYSSHADYSAQEQGAWHITQTASASSTSAAKLEIKAESILKGDGKDKDIFVMLDTSGSMTSNRISKMMDAIIGLSNTLLATGNGNNRIALSAFNSDVVDVAGWSDDASGFRISIYDNMPGVGGGTNYYKAIQKIDETFSRYTYDENRNPIVLFITDGAPVEDHPLEESEYLVLKDKYPWLTVQGIQFEMGDTIINQIKKVSDNQFASNIENVEDVVFEAAMDGYKYSEFLLNDYINDEYYEVASANATIGNVTVDQNRILWDMSNFWRSGTKQTLTVLLNIKQACIDKEDSLCAVNTHTSVSTKLKDAADESIDTTETPVLQFRFDVSYDLNLPNSCDAGSSTAPATTKQVIYTSVEISSDTPSCAGYRFDGWSLISDATYRYNENYFRMPEEDVLLRAVWSKPSISKTTEGTIAPTTYATFKKASTINHYNGYYTLYSTAAGSLSNIERIIYSTDKPPIDAPLDEEHNFADANSDLPIYGYYVAETKTFYFYSDADVVQLNLDSSGLLAEFTNLKSIEGIGKFDASHVEYLNYLFYRTRGGIASPEDLASWELHELKSLDAAFFATGFSSLHGIEHWDVSNVTNFDSLFRGSSSLNDLSALLEWDTGSVTTLSSAFRDLANLTNLHGLENWDVSKVTMMNSMFEGSPMLENVDALARWNTESLTNLAYTFVSSHWSGQANELDISGLSGWDVSKVTDMTCMFGERLALRNIDALSSWRPVKLIYLGGAFSYTNIANLNGLSGWRTPELISMDSTFMDCYKLANIEGLRGWDVSALQSAHRIIARDSLVTSLAPLEDWRTGNLTDLSGAFWGTSIVNATGLENWDVSKVTSMDSTFAGTYSLEDISALAGWETDSLVMMVNFLSGATKLPNLHGLESWNVSKVTNMRSMCNDCFKLESISALRAWRPVALASIETIFRNTRVLASLDGLQDWRTPVLGNMLGAFSGSYELTNVAELAGWTVGTVTSMESLFYDDSNLSDIAALSGWDTSANQTLSYAFANTAIQSVAALSGWDTANNTSFMGTFRGTKLINLNGLSGWDVKKVSTMYLAFAYIPTLTSISGLNGWVTSSLGRFDEVFTGDTALMTLDGLQGWDVSKVSVMNYLFKDCTSLADISALSGWSTGRVNGMGEIFRNDTSLANVSALAGWNVESVTNINQGFRNTGVTDFSPLDGWQLPSGSNTSNIFANTPEGAIMPEWY